MKVAGQTVDLELPTRAAIRHDLYASAATDRGREQTARRVVAAALLLCWPGTARKSDTPAPRYRGDVLEFGGDALDFFFGLGATAPEIMTAGNAAIQLVIDSFPTKEDLAKARGNSPAPEVGGSERSSPSSGSTRDGPLVG